MVVLCTRTFLQPLDRHFTSLLNVASILLLLSFGGGER